MLHKNESKWTIGAVKMTKEGSHKGNMKYATCCKCYAEFELDINQLVGTFYDPYIQDCSYCKSQNALHFKNKKHFLTEG